MQPVGLAECIQGNGYEEQHYKGAYHDTDYAKAWQPFLVIPAYGLEHGPEAVVDVQPKGYEPNNIAKHHPPVAECCKQQQVRVVFCFGAYEFLKLHLGPEVEEVEAKKAENQKAEDDHVLSGP